MYTLSCFSEANAERVAAMIDRYGFATLISNRAGELQITHLPLQLDRSRGMRGTLIGHVARANPHASFIRNGEAVMAIFHGPHNYISPSWYVDENPRDPNVPTWNYVAVHTYGRVRRIDDATQKWKIVTALARQYEQNSSTPWKPGNLAEQAGKLAGIVGFEIEIDRIEAKTKLSQNRSFADQNAVIGRLESRARGDDHAMAALMRENIAVSS